MTLLIISIQTLQTHCTLRSSLIYTSGNVVCSSSARNSQFYAAYSKTQGTAHSERQTAYAPDEAAAVVVVGNSFFFSFSNYRSMQRLQRVALRTI